MKIKQIIILQNDYFVFLENNAIIIMLLKGKNRIPFINKVFSYSFLKTDTGISTKLLLLREPKERTNGVSSYCTDGKHVLFFDYDNNSVEEVTQELFLLQEAYCLSDIHIFVNDRENSFAAFCLDKFPLYDAIEIISQTSADKAFKKAPLLYGLRRWVYRYDKKGERKPPEYLTTISANKNADYEKSNAHREFLNTVFDLDIKKDNYFDDYSKIDLYSYLTSQKIKLINKKKD